MHHIIKAAPILFCLVTIGGCIALPASDTVVSNHISGEPNTGETLFEVRTTYGMQVLLSAEGSRRMVHGGSSSYAYYIDKNGERDDIEALSIWASDNPWTDIEMVNQQWYAFGLSFDANKIKVVKFNFMHPSTRYWIPVTHTGAVAEIYVSKNNNYLVWKEWKAGYYKFDFNSEHKQFIGPTLSADVLATVTRVKGSTRYFEESNFEAAAHDGDPHEYGGNKADYFATTSSVEELTKQSDSSDYVMRWAVAVNPNTPTHILEKLSNDLSYDVAMAARRRLQNHPEAN